MQMKLKTRLMAATLSVGIGTALGGCVSDQPVNSPCGVIVDSLIDVKSTTRDGNRRLSNHFERGRAAGCWTSGSGPKISAVK